MRAFQLRLDFFCDLLVRLGSGAVILSSSHAAMLVNHRGSMVSILKRGKNSSHLISLLKDDRVLNTKEILTDITLNTTLIWTIQRNQNKMLCPINNAPSNLPPNRYSS